MKRRPTWAFRTFLLENGVAWDEVRAMTPPELMERAKAIHAKRRTAR